MLTILKESQGVLATLEKTEKDAWINVVNPTELEVERLKKEFNVPDEFIQDILDIDERSRLEVYGRWVMMIIRIPVHNPSADLPFYTVPLGVLISPRTLITICLTDNEVLRDFTEHRIKTPQLSNKHTFVLHVFLRSATQYLKYLKEINRQMSSMEKELQNKLKNEDLNILLKMEKCLVYFVTSLKSNDLLLNRLQRFKIAESGENDQNQHLLEDAFIETKQAIETAQIYSEITGSLMQNFNSLISNNLSVVMKQLTTVTTILMIPTLVSGIFGMNLTSHIESNPHAFFYVVGGIAALMISTVLLFKFRKFL